jgi:hypothetical protein
MEYYLMLSYLYSPLDIDHIARVPDTPEGSVSVASNAANSTVTTPGPSTSDRKKGPSSRELEQRQKSWLKNINLLWSEISNHKNGAMFMNPIKENIAPRYYEIVKRPMDLKQIKQRIRDGVGGAEKQLDVPGLMIDNDIHMIFISCFILCRQFETLWNSNGISY